LDASRLREAFAHPDARVVGDVVLARLRAEADAVAVVRPFGTVSLYLPGGARRHRVLDVDRDGHVTLAIRRGDRGELLEAWAREVHGRWLGVLPRGSEHPIWGESDRLVMADLPGTAKEPLTVFGAVDWGAIAAIPPLAEPARLPPGAGTTVLNLLAALAADQSAGPLRYRGPYASEQLFWALTESFRFDGRAPDPLATFLAEAEAAFAAGAMQKAPLDWLPTPHERHFSENGFYVQLRDGVEKVWWHGRGYYRTDWQGLGRREHRVVRRRDGGYVVGLQALGQLVEEHLWLDTRGELVGTPAPSNVDAAPDVPLDLRWREALGFLLPLEATPLLATAIGAVWPALDVAWAGVREDLVEAGPRGVRLARALAACYRAERAAAPPDQRARAQQLVREVLGLIGPTVRQAAVAWLEAEPPARQAALLDAAERADRATLAAHAAARLAPLLDALIAGEALPS
jgi:hypothetical protein